MTSSDVNIIFEEEPVEITLNEDPVEIEIPAGQNGQSIHPRGAWSSSESYGYLDLVSYQGSSYVATKTVPTGTLPTDTGFWMLSAEKGLDGASEWGDITGDIANQTDLAQALAGKANVGDSYTKAETDSLLADKADADDVYSKSETDSLLSDKANSADVYTKDETDALLQDKAPVILNSASGSIASFTDGSTLPVEDLSVAIEPVQDLHGYDAPWPAGGGKNKWEFNSTIDVSSTFVNCTFTNPLPAGTYTFSAVVTSTASYCDIRFRDESGEAIDRTVIQANVSGRSTITFTVSASVYRIYLYPSTNTTGTASFKDIQLESGSSATTYAPYSNICPISGHTSATVTRTGKNLCDKIVSNEMATGSVSDGVFTSTERTGTRYLNVARLVLNQPVLLKAGVTYYFALDIKLTSGTGLINTINLLTSANDGIERTNVSVPTPSATYQHFILKCTLATDTLISKMYVQGQNCSNAVFVITNPMISTEPISPESTFEPYQGTFVTIDLDGTRYGGTLNVTTGMLTVDRVQKTLTGTEGFTLFAQSGNNPRRFMKQVSSLSWETPADYSEPISNQFVYSQTASASEKFGTIRVSAYVTFPDSESIFADATDFNTWLATQNNNGTPVVINYVLATPVTVQLTPAQMQTLLGENHIWADTGNVEVTYRADTKLFIEGQIAENETLTRKMIADIATADGKAPKSIATGDLIIVGDELRKATANIGNGSAITASNSTTATLADVIKALQ